MSTPRHPARWVRPVRDAMFLAGSASIAGFLWLCWPPLILLAGGLALVAIALVGWIADARRKDGDP